MEVGYLVNNFKLNLRLTLILVNLYLGFEEVFTLAVATTCKIVSSLIRFRDIIES